MDNTEVKITFQNKVKGFSGKTGLVAYEEKLKSVKNLIESMPQNINFGGNVDKKLDSTNKILTQINKNIFSLGKNATSSFKKMSKSVDRINNDFKKMKKSNKEVGEGITNAFGVMALKQFGVELERLVTNSTKFIKKSAEYTENLNLLAVAFREEGKEIEDTTNEAMKFVNTMSEMYGLEESKLIRTTGLFKQMANSLGITNEAGTKLSQTLTRLSVDAASLFNAEEIEDAAKVFQSALASQTKPIRSFTGADITQQTLQVTLDTYGIDEAITDLSYAEKRLVIVASLVDQLDEAIGDFGRTIESPANQMKIFTEQAQRLARAIGNVLMPVFAKILPYINAFMMVLVELTSYVANFVAKLFGYDFENFNPFASMDESIVDMEEDMNSAGEAAKKLKSGLRGFDKLNVISSGNDKKDNGSAGSGVGGAYYDLLDKAVEKYNSKLQNTEMLATKIRDSIMGWLGFTKVVDEETGKVSFKFEKITSGLTTVASILSVGVLNTITKVYKLLSKIGLLPKIELFAGGISAGTITTIAAIAAAIGIVGYALYDLYQKDKEFAKSFNENWASLQEAAQPVIDKLSELFSTLRSHFDQTIIPMFQEAFKIIQVIAKTLLDILFPVFEKFILPIIGLVIDIIKDCFEVIDELWSQYGKPISDMIKQAIEDIGTVFNKLWTQFLEPIVTKTINIMSDLWKNTLKPMFKKIGEVIGELIELILVLWDNVLQPVVNWLIDVLAPVFETVFSFVADVFQTAYKFIGGIINGILDILKGIIKFLTGIFKGDFKKAWEGIVDILKGVLNIGISIVEGMMNAIISLINLGIKGIWNGIKGLVNSVLSTVESIADILGYDIDITLKGKAPQIDKVNIPRLKAGIDFVPSDYFPAFLDYGERVLTKEENQDYNRGIIRGENAVSSSPVNATFVIQVGNKEIAKTVLNDLQSMAKSNGKPITIG